MYGSHLQVCVKRSSPPIPSGLGRELVEILQKCFAFESTERPSAMEVLEVILFPLIFYVVVNLVTKCNIAQSKIICLQILVHIVFVIY
jgi:hypothetical protein